MDQNIANDKPILMKIGQLSKQSNTHKSTIHHYINIGLLPPPYKKNGGRLHFFNHTHLARLNLIKKLRKNKLSLSKIKELFDKGELSLEKSPVKHLDEFNKSYFDYKILNSEALQDKKSEIIDAAVELFSQNVYGSVRMEDISKKAKVPKATIYQFFSGKKDLFMACIEKISDKIIIPIQQLDAIKKETDFFKRFHKRILAFLINFSSFRNALNLSRTVLGNPDPKLRDKAINAFKLIARAPLNDVLEAQKNGTVRNINPEIVSFILCGMAEILGQKLEMDPRFDIEEVTDIYIDFIEHGLSTTPKFESNGLIVNDISAYVIIESDIKTKIKKIRFNNEKFLPAKIADAKIEVDLNKISTLIIQKTSSSYKAVAKLNNGEEISLNIDPNLLVTGEMIIGPIEIEISRINKIIFK